MLDDSLCSHPLRTVSRPKTVMYTCDMTYHKHTNATAYHTNHNDERDMDSVSAMELADRMRLSVISASRTTLREDLLARCAVKEIGMPRALRERELGECLAVSCRAD